MYHSPKTIEPEFEASVVVVLVCVLYGITSLLSIYGNTLVIWIVTTTKALQNVNNLFIANLALSDVTIALFCMPFQFYAALVQRWDLPEFMCKFCPMAQMASINVSIFTLIAICKERYVFAVTNMNIELSNNLISLHDIKLLPDCLLHSYSTLANLDII